MATLLLCLLVPAQGLWSAPPIPPLPDPSNRVNYFEWMQRTYRPPVEQDATELYAKANLLFPDYGDTDERLAPFLRGPWRECDLEMESRFIKYEWSLRTFKEATDRTRCFLPLVEFGDFADFILGIDFDAITFPAHASIALAWREFAGGDTEPTIEAARRCLIAADHLAQQPLIMGTFEGATLSNLGCSTLLRAIHHSSDVPQLLERHSVSVLSWTAPDVDARRGFAGEQIGAFDALQRCFTWNAETKKYVVEPKGARRALVLNGWKRPEAYAAAIKKIKVLDFVSAREAVTRYFALVQDLLALPYDQAIDRSLELDAFADAATSDPLVPLFLYKTSAVVQARHRQATAKARWHGMRLVWLLMMYQHFTGSLPASLSEDSAPPHTAIEFANTQGLRWEYHPSDKSFTLSIAGFRRNAHEASRAFTDKITIWPLKDK